MLRKRAPPPSRERLKAASTRNLRSMTDSVRLSRGLSKRRTSALSTRSETAPNPESHMHPPSTSAPASAATNSTQFVAVPPSSGATFSQPGTSIAQLSGIGCPPVPAALTSGPYHVLSGGSGVTGTYSGESIIDFNANANHSTSSVATTSVMSPYMGIGTGMPILNQQILPAYPALKPSVFDNISAHIPLKLKEKIWQNEYIDLDKLLKSAKELACETKLSGDLIIHDGRIAVEETPRKSSLDIETWTSAFLIFMSISLEKCPNQAQDLLKYMKDIRFAAKNSNGWALYDEQFRLRRAGRPGISWGLISSEMWAMYVLMGTKSSQLPHNDVTENMGRRKRLTCRIFNQGTNCKYGKSCIYSHSCSNCGKSHPEVTCFRKEMHQLNE